MKKNDPVFDIALRAERIYLRKGNMPEALRQALKDAKAEIVKK